MKYLLFGLLFCLTFFAPLFKGNYLFPGSFMTAWYEPWKSEMGLGGAPTIVHKPLADDVFRQLYPMKKFAAEAFSTFQLPLWNPYNGAGQPLLATMHPGYLNPFSLLLSLFPNGFGWTLYVLFQIPFLFTGMFLYMRIIGVSRIGAFISSVALCLSGFVSVRIVYGDYVYALAFFVWLLASIEWYRNHVRQKFVLIFCALFTACIWFSTQPQIAFYLLIYAIVYSYIIFHNQSLSHEYRIVNHEYWEKLTSVFSLPAQTGICSSVFIAILLGTGIASIQLLPTLELYRLSVIDAGTSSFIIDRFLLPVSHYISFLIPNFFGNQGTYNYFGAGDFVESIAAYGSIPLLLVLLSWVSGKLSKRLFWFLAISAIGAIALSISSPFTRVIYGIPIPILSTSVPTRILMLAVFSLSVLAGFGADYLFREKHTNIARQFLFFVGFLIVFVLLYALYLYNTHVSCPSPAIANCRITSVRTTFFELFVFLSCSLFFLISVRVKAKWIQNLFIMLSILMFAGAGLYNAEKLLPFSPKDMMYPNSEFIEEIQALSREQRIFGIGEGKISTNIATEFKILDPEYYDPLYIKRYGELVAYANQGVYPPVLKRSDVEIVRDASVSAEMNVRRNRLFDLLSVRYLYGKTVDLLGKPIWQSKAYHIIDRPASLPHAYVVHQYKVLLSDKDILKELFDPSFDPQSSVILEIDPSVDLSTQSISPKGGLTPLDTREVSREISHNEYLKFSVKTSTPGIFVITDNFYPGWRAKVDGKETKIFRANYTFRGVALEKGEHTVEFFYKPDSLRYGMLLSLISFLVLAVFVLRSSILKARPACAGRP